MLNQQNYPCGSRKARGDNLSTGNEAQVAVPRNEGNEATEEGQHEVGVHRHRITYR